MSHEPVKNVPSLIHGCENCGEKKVLSLTFRPRQLVWFYLIVLPGFVLGSIKLYFVGISALIVWLAILALFFGMIEIRVLCTHCPHYAEPGMFLKCWANYGMPKLWRHRPYPMRMHEKVILLAGFIIVWGYPVPFMAGAKEWLLLIIYFILTAGFFTLLLHTNCRRCINFFCPLNRVSKEKRDDFRQEIARHNFRQ